jgi:hypothetical protein
MNGVFLGFRNFWKQSFWGWVGLREAVSAHIPDRGGDLWIIISLTMTRLHVLVRAILFLNMGTFFGVLVLGGILSTRQMVVVDCERSAGGQHSQDIHISKLFGCVHHWGSSILGFISFY